MLEAADTVLGARICYSGRHSESCGYVEQENVAEILIGAREYDGGPPAVLYGTIVGLTKLRFIHTTGGDSGGPLYASAGNGVDVLAAGVLTGSEGSCTENDLVDDIALYTPIDRAVKAT